MQIIKKTFIFALVFSILLSFAACGGNGSDDDSVEDWNDYGDRGDNDQNDDQDDDRDNNSNISGDKNSEKDDDKTPDNDTETSDIAATINGQNLNSVQANYYFADYVHNVYSQFQVSFGSDVNSYLNLLGLDATKPLNEQFYDQQLEKTWADHYLEEALEQAKSDYALYSKALAEGYQLPIEQQNQFDTLKDTVKTYAGLYGFTSADKYLEARYGKGASFDSYYEYAKISTVASAYYVNHMQSLSYDDAAIRAFEKTNESHYATFNTNPLANVRHLLIAFENGTNALAEAERILKIWENGSRTEESFIELVRLYTDDEASKENGGLYKDIHPQSSYVTNFLNWAIDPSHKTGDIGIVETEYGYHIMYFAGYSQTTYRDYIIQEDMRTKDITDWYNAIMDSTVATVVNTEKVNMNIVLANS